MWAPAAFTLQVRFLVLISVTGWVEPRAVMQPEALSQQKIPMTTLWIEPAGFRLVLLGLNKLRPQGPPPPPRHFHVPIVWKFRKSQPLAALETCLDLDRRSDLAVRLLQNKCNSICVPQSKVRANLIHIDDTNWIQTVPLCCKQMCGYQRVVETFCVTLEPEDKHDV
jgi:hypothetical protein